MLFLNEKAEALTTPRTRTLPLTRAAIFLLGGFMATPLMAQGTNVQAPSDDEIVVEGLRDKKQAIENYVGGLTVASPSLPLARYQEGEYCPAVMGLSPVRNEEIAARMRTVAATAGVKPAKPGCAPSALVFFVDNKETFAAALRAQHPVYFTDLQGSGLTAPKAQGPALAWQLVQLVDPQGIPVNRSPGDGYNVVESSTRGSRILSMVSSVVAMSVVIVERRALVGLSVTQIADYALMRTLTDRDPEALDVPANVTILKALRAPIGTAVPASLTQWDLAYVQGRYSGHASRYGGSQSAAIRNQMRRALTARPEE